MPPPKASVICSALKPLRARLETLINQTQKLGDDVLPVAIAQEIEALTRDLKDTLTPPIKTEKVAGFWPRDLCDETNLVPRWGRDPEEVLE